MNTMDVALICKALGDSNRLQIVQMLSEGEKCGCKLLEAFEITQPTLSHHMRILTECGLVNARKEGKCYFNVAKLNLLVSSRIPVFVGEQLIPFKIEQTSQVSVVYKIRRCV